MTNPLDDNKHNDTITAPPKRQDDNTTAVSPNDATTPEYPLRGRAAEHTEERLNEIFVWWYHHEQNYSETATQFDCHRQTIARWSEKYGWHARADKIKSDIAKQIDRKITKESVSHVTLIEMCLTEEVSAYIAQKVKPGNLRDIVAMCKYIDDVNSPNELAEAIRAAAKLDDLPYDPVLAKEARDLLNEAIEETEERLKV